MPFALLQPIPVPFSPEPASSVSGEVDTLYLFLVALTIFFGVLISLLVVYFAVKYRRRSDDEYPRPIEGSVVLETAWTVIPFLITMVIFVWGAKIYYAMYRTPAEAMDIYVVGKQWMWKFEHPNGRREINELHLPIGRRVKFTMGTEDVIHSLYFPAFRMKADVVPGRFTNMWTQPTKAGQYHIFCAEYCGTQHSGMIGTLYVMEPAEYEAWLAGDTGEPRLSPEQAGERLFADQACNTCHLTTEAGRCPPLAGVYGKQVQLADGRTVVADDNYIRESILNPQAKIVAGYEQQRMNSYQGLLTEEQLLQLIAYVKSLQGADAGSSAAPGQPAAPGGPGR